nr:unnamed protein product [Callosobruchus analis]
MVKHPEVAGKRIFRRSSVRRKVHECTKCIYKSVSAKYLKRHMSTHSDRVGNRITNRCIYCNKTFVFKRTLDDHIVRKHPDFIATVSKEVHECPKCTYKTVSTNYLKRHMGFHRDSADNHITNKCIYCTKTLSSKQALDDHVIKTHPDFIASVSSKVHECTRCTYKTTSNSHLKRHMIVKHANVADIHITNRCIYCNKTFTSKQALDGHIIKTHPDFIASVSSKVHGCTECTYRTTSNSNLKRHMDTHPDIAGNHVFRCIYCKNTLTCKKVLDDHIVKKHPDFIASISSKVHECTKCSFKTVHPSRLKKHIKVKHPDIDGNHITNRCIYCNKTFTSKQALDGHIIKTHPDFIASVTSKVHECTECTYKTTSNECIRQHIMAKHPETADNHIFSRCMYCNNTFTCRRVLDDPIVKRHPDFIASVSRKVHKCTNVTKNETQRKGKQVVADKKTDGDMFVCYHCECAARSKYHLIDHMSEHTDSKNIYSCYYCDFRTNSRILFATHTRTHSSESTQFEAIYIKEEDADHFKLANGTHSVVKHQDIASNPELRRSSVSRKIHGCTQCAYKTVSTNYLKRHMGSHPGNHTTARCIYCNITFVQKQTLDDHIVKTHPDFIASVNTKIHECTQGTYKTTIPKDIREHLMSKHTEIADNHIFNRCIYCNNTFTSKPSLDDHIVKRHPDFIASVSRKIHECTNCTFKTVRLSRLKEHIKVKHPDTASDRIINNCIYCNKTFVHKRTLNDHIVKTHPDFAASVNRKIFECTECTYKTVSTNDLKRHMMVKHPDIAGGRITVRCSYCNKTFISKSSLDDHILKTHPDFIASVSRKVHECTECTYKTVFTSQLRRHMVKHPDIAAGNRIFIRCIYCNKSFTRKLALDDHIVKRHPDFIASVTSQVHECTKCTYKTTSNSDLKRHMVKHSDIAAGDHITNRCTHCNKTFTSTQALDDHIVKRHPYFIASVSRKVHECTECTYKTVLSKNEIPRKAEQVVADKETDGDTFVCYHCAHETGNKRHLIDHMKVHRNSKNVYNCYFCDFRTNSRILFTTHTRAHTSESTQFKAINIRKTDFDDNFCQANTTHLLVKHPEIAVKKHSDFIACISNKVHGCTKCTYKTTSNSHLKRHMVKHSDIAGDHITNRCTHCNKTFTSTQALDDHIVKRHPDFIASVSRKVHECTECTYKTVFSSQLRRHMAKHPNIADDRITNRCSCCNKTFVRKETLDDHIVKMHPDFIAYVSRKVHECTQCIYKTTSNSYLKRHMVKHSDIAVNRISIRCIYCDKTLTSKPSLDDHIVKRHPDFIASVGRKVHECTKCTFKTVFTSQLRNHMVKHPDIGSNRITNKCIHCNKTFTSKQAVDDHIIKTHPDFTASVSSKVHECTECTYKTTSNSHLKRHMAKHTDIAGI